MESICDDPDCTNIINKPTTKEGIPKLMAEIRTAAIDNILAENVETFHVHQYGSMVIFLEYLEGLDPSDEMVDEYGKQGHVFLLPMKPFDLISLRDKKIKQITYKASDSVKVWYKITITLKSKGVGNKLKNLFH